MNNTNASIPDLSIPTATHLHDPEWPVPAPCPQGGHSPARPSSSAVLGVTAKRSSAQRSNSRALVPRPRGIPAHAWETAPSYRTGSETLAPRTIGRRLSGARQVWEATADIHAAEQEHLIAFDLNVRHQIIARRVVAIGMLTGVEVHPREVFRRAIANGAAAIVIVHNHPSGDFSPSRQDIDLTIRLRDTGELCGIQLLDHVVVASSGFHSITEHLRS